MLRKLLVPLILAIPAFAGAQPVFVTGNQYVWAEVDSLTGGIWFGAGSAASHVLGDTTHELSANGRSFLDVSVNDTDVVNGDSVKTSKFADTIQTIWQRGGFDIVQNVYPVEFGISGTIVLSIEVINHRGTPIVAQAQYFLNDDVDGINLDEYGARSLEIYPRGDLNSGDGPVDVYYPSDGYPVPPFFMTFTRTDSQKTYLSDDVGVCYLSDSLAPVPLGLINPSAIIIGDAGVGSGFPAEPTGWYPSSFEDQTIMWSSDTVGGAGNDSVALIGRTCYGTGDYDVCSGGSESPWGFPLTAITLYPHLIHMVNGKPVPNTFTIETIIVGDTSKKGSATLSVTGKQSIVDPLPVSNGGASQSQPIVPQFAGEESGFDLMYVRWTDSVFATKNGPIALLLTINDSIFADPLHEVQTCSLSTNVTKIIYPTPIGNVISRSGSYDGSECNTRSTEVVAYDTGIIRIPVLSVHADSLTNMRLSIAPNYAGADSTFYTVSVVDSMLNGDAVITLTDSLGDTATERYEYCTIPDTHAPLVQQLFCTDSEHGIKAPMTCTYEVSDSQAWDRGLDTIYMTANNQPVVSLGSVHGDSVVQFGVVNGLLPVNLCITAIDLAGNRFDTCFENTASVLAPQQTPLTISIYPNPASGDVTIFMEGTPSADVEIFDVLGREVDHFQVNGSYDWETSGLPTGTYIIHANENGPGNSQPIVKRIVKE
jgi:Secretion system C-terminal sorting domain